MMEAATSDELRTLPYQVPPHVRGVGTRQPSVGPLFTQNAVPSPSCRTATLVTNFWTVQHSYIPLLFIVTHLCIPLVFIITHSNCFM